MFFLWPRTFWSGHARLGGPTLIRGLLRCFARWPTRFSALDEWRWRPIISAVLGSTKEKKERVDIKRFLYQSGHANALTDGETFSSRSNTCSFLARNAVVPDRVEMLRNMHHPVGGETVSESFHKRFGQAWKTEVVQTDSRLWYQREKWVSFFEQGLFWLQSRAFVPVAAFSIDVCAGQIKRSYLLAHSAPLYPWGPHAALNNNRFQPPRSNENSRPAFAEIGTGRPTAFTAYTYQINLFNYYRTGQTAKYTSPKVSNMRFAKLCAG